MRKIEDRQSARHAIWEALAPTPRPEAGASAACAAVLATLLATVLATGLGACAVTSSSYGSQRQLFEQQQPLARALDLSTDPFDGATELTLLAYVEAVAERSPSIEAARQSWRMALAQEPQAGALPDPMLSLGLAPLSFVDADVPVGIAVELSQRVLYPGKRRLRVEAAEAEAEAARHDVAAVRARLRKLAASLYLERHILERAIATNQRHEARLRALADTVGIYLTTGRASQGDALRIEGELAVLERERLSLEAERDVFVIRMNALLHRPPDSRLPPLAELAPLTLELPSAATLTARATANRSELAALSARERSAMQSARLAEREYLPDGAVSVSYNRMWHEFAHQIMVGLSIELPWQRAARAGGVEREQSRAAMLRAAQSQLADQVSEEVAIAWRRVVAADAIVTVYRERTRPIAFQRIETIHTGVELGRDSLVDAISAERELLGIELDYERAVTEAHRSRIELAWAVGDYDPIQTTAHESDRTTRSEQDHE